MKTTILLLLSIFLISGCKTPSIITQTTTDTQYRDTTIYVDVPVWRDTTIYVPIPGYRDSVIIRDSVRIKDGQAYMKSVYKEIGLIGVSASVYNSKLSVDAFLTDSTILYNLKDTFNFQDSVKIYNAIKLKTTTNTVVLPPEKYIPRFYNFAFWLLIIELILIALFVFYKMGYFGVFGNRIKRFQAPK